MIAPRFPAARVEHTCHARGCTTPVARCMLMCPRHWRRVPAPLRARVLATYQPGQEAGRAPVTAAWREAAAAAIEAVAAVEGGARG